MNILIYDDNLEFIDVISKTVDAINVKHNGIFGVPRCLNDANSVLDYIDNNKHDQTVFLLDIVADDIDVGYMLAEKIKESDSNSIVIYITDYMESILYDMKQKLTALCFISKTSSHFHEELESALLYAQEILEDKFFLTGETNKEVFRVRYDDIYYFEKQKRSHYIQIVHKNGYSIFRSSLANLIDTLDRYFCYSSKEFIVNTRNIKNIDKKTYTIHFDEGVSCPFSITRRNELLRLLK